MAHVKRRTLLEKAQDRLSNVTNTLTGYEQPEIEFPPFDQLPKIHHQPQGCLWGFFDKHGVKDELGTLNLLTPSVVRRAAGEIQTGEHIQLDACLDDYLEFPGFYRRGFEHTILDAHAVTKGRHFGFDDEVRFNTQSGSQWDSLRHFAHQGTGMYYNGLSHAHALKDQSRNSLQRVNERGGIVGRGVLVDWYAWCLRTKGAVPAPTTRHEIPIAEVDACLQAQGTVTRHGDILIVRSGFKKWHDAASGEERKRGTQGRAVSIGLQASEETVKWLYDRQLAAVAGDMVAFEAWPPKYGPWGCLHEWCLVQWGMPIGELWDLERLSEACERLGRWTFFLTSAPLHLRGGVGSPPGAIAVL